MIHNPPYIFLLLRAWNTWLRQSGKPATDGTAAIALSHLFARLIGAPPYDVFLKTYQLYLQSIPLETAKAAWGLNAAAANLTHQSK